MKYSETTPSNSAATRHRFRTAMEAVEALLETSLHPNDTPVHTITKFTESEAETMVCDFPLTGRDPEGNIKPLGPNFTDQECINHRLTLQKEILDTMIKGIAAHDSQYSAQHSGAVGTPDGKCTVTTTKTCLEATLADVKAKLIQEFCPNI